MCVALLLHHSYLLLKLGGIIRMYRFYYMKYKLNKETDKQIFFIKYKLYKNEFEFA